MQCRLWDYEQHEGIMSDKFSVTCGIVNNMRGLWTYNGTRPPQQPSTLKTIAPDHHNTHNKYKLWDYEQHEGIMANV